MVMVASIAMSFMLSCMKWFTAKGETSIFILEFQRDTPQKKKKKKKTQMLTVAEKHQTGPQIDYAQLTRDFISTWSNLRSTSQVKW